MNRLNILFLLVTALAAFDLFRTLRTGSRSGQVNIIVQQTTESKREAA